MIKRYLALLVIVLCAFSLCFHFVVEGLGGVQDHITVPQATGVLHSHDGDLFVLGEKGSEKFSQLVSCMVVNSNLGLVSEPLRPPFHPPRSL